MHWQINLIGILLMASCSNDPAPIRYGQDTCDYCRMTIMDPRFGGEIVTRKGRVYKFDSEECLVKYFKSHHSKSGDFAKVVVNNFAQPGQLLDADQAVFLQENTIRSPMGGNTAAFSNKAITGKAAAENGRLIKWNELLKTEQ